MLEQLESNYLEVVLIPAAEQRHAGHSVRVVQYANCIWYRRFCAMYSSSRKDQNKKGRTLIKRRETIAALNKMIAHIPSKSVYVERLFDFMSRENSKAKAVGTFEVGFPF